jgi:hypothetical protein
MRHTGNKPPPHQEIAGHHEIPYSKVSGVPTRPNYVPRKTALDVVQKRTNKVRRNENY